MRIIPVRFRDRWIDDGSRIELWTPDRSAGLRLDVASTGTTEPLVAITIRRTPSGAPSESVSLIVELAAGEIRFQSDHRGVLDPPVDLAWLRGQLDDELRAALQQRVEREPRAFDPYDWKVGDQARVAPGEHVLFSQLFPAAWDLVESYRGKRYALLDTHRIAEDAEHGPVTIEIVDLDTCELVGTAEIDLAGDPTTTRSRPRAPMWRCTGPIADPLLTVLRQDPDRWFNLVERADGVARTARMMAAWHDDVRDPVSLVRRVLGDPDDVDEDLLDRLMALGTRCVPTLLPNLDHPDAATSQLAARLLADLGDASGVDRLVTVVADPDFDDLAEAVVHAIVSLGERAVDPLLAALTTTQDRSTQERLLDVLIATDVHDDRIRDHLVELVRAEPGRASLLGVYGEGSPGVVAVLVEALGPCLRALHASLEDDVAFDDASEIAGALRDLGVGKSELLEFDHFVDGRREALRIAMRGSRETDDDLPFGPPRYTPPAPVRVAPRPGRNEPCWCGSTKKYKKCHLDDDDAKASTR